MVQSLFLSAGIFLGVRVTAVLEVTKIEFTPLPVQYLVTCMTNLGIYLKPGGAQLNKSNVVFVLLFSATQYYDI